MIRLPFCGLIKHIGVPVREWKTKQETPLYQSGTEGFGATSAPAPNRGAGWYACRR